MKTTARPKAILAAALVLAFAFALPVSAAGSSSQTQRATLPVSGASPTSKSTFAFVSNFEDMALDGWSSVSGTAPTVVTSPNYSGEPSLQSKANGGVQVDTASKGFVTGLSALSFQVAIHASGFYTGLIGYASSGNTFVAVLGIINGSVVAGQNPSDLVVLGKIPTGTAYPPGWTYIIANVDKNSSGWWMGVYVDQTAVANGTISVPNAGTYTSAQIETAKGTVYYTNVIFSTQQMAIVIPGYNNMEGYGQGSALLVKQLPAYKNLTARMALNSWSVPQSDTLSFQINSMNETGTTENTCVGFFQLGLWLDPSGKVDLWYVPGVDCEPHFFSGGLGVSTPKGTQLVLSIIFKASSHQVLFKIVDTSISKTFSATIPYEGGAFFGAYTQMEFQPCCNNHPINDYKLNGSLYDLAITTTGGKTEPLPASYMLPFSLDAPTSWDFTYYQNSIAGYAENSK